MEKGEKHKQFEAELKELLKKYNFELGGTVNFPLYKQLPIEVQLALKILAKHEVQYACAVKEVNANKS